MSELSASSGEAIEAGSIMLIIDCLIDSSALTSEGWEPGPMPFEANVNGARITADGPTRSTFFARPVAHVLYGDSENSLALPRVHKLLMAPIGSGAIIAEAEIMLASEQQGWRGDFGVFGELLIHLDISAIEEKNQMEYLHRALRTRAGRMDFLKAVDLVLGDPVHVSASGEHGALADGRIFSLFCVGVEDDPGSDGNRMLGLATLTPPMIRPPSSEEVSRAVVDTLHPSDDWAVLVRRDGAVIERRLATEFSTASFFYSRTIYLDIFSLGRLQSRMLAELSARLIQTIMDGLIVLNAVQRLEHDVAVFRAAYVWRSISSSFVGNELIGAYQNQQELHQSLAELRDNVAALASAATLRAVTLAERSSRQSNATLSVLTVFGLPLTLAMVIWQTYGGGLWQLAVAIVCALVASAGAILLLPGLRTVIRALRTREE